MISLAPRILALPADVRRALARVDGPGWAICRIAGVPTVGARTAPSRTSDRYGEAFWPANPAAAVVAVTGVSIWYAHQIIALDGSAGGDVAAALSIIEAHVADRSSDG